MCNLQALHYLSHTEYGICLNVCSMKTALKSFELLENLGIKLIDVECKSKSENLQFWYEGFLVFINLPSDVIDAYDESDSVDLIKLLISYTFIISKIKLLC